MLTRYISIIDVLYIQLLTVMYKKTTSSTFLLKLCSTERPQTYTTVSKITTAKTYEYD